MNAISVTMVKGTASQSQHGHALRLMAMFVTLSWAGWQMLIISGCYQKRAIGWRAEQFLEGGLVLLLYSLYLLLRLKRKEVLPTRESAQLFFGAFLLALPGATFAMWRYLHHLLMPHGNALQVYGANVPLVYASIVISVIYAVLTLNFLLIHISNFEMAKSGDWSFRIMRRLEAMVITPYFKK